MNINRNTYEEYFILYIDNELSAAERAEVEEFVAANPDLRQELEMLKDTVLPVDNITFNKESLFRSNQPVTMSNYGEYFVLYADHELFREAQEQVEQFVYRHPQYQAEFEAILCARTEPDTSIVFRNKEVLFRSEKQDRPIIYMRFWKVAVAAVALLFVGGMGWYFSTRESNHTGGLANVNVPDTQKTITPPSATPKPSALASAPINTPAAGNEATAEFKAASNSTVLRSTRAIQSGSKTTVAAVSKKSFTERNISTLPAVEHKTSDMTAIDTKAVTQPDAQMIASTMDVQIHIVDRAVSEEELRTGTLKPEIIDATESNDNDVVYVANTSVNKKNKLRGVFRKASRIFEKATNIDPTEGDRAVRIAGFEIALK